VERGLGEKLLANEIGDKPDQRLWNPMWGPLSPACDGKRNIPGGTFLLPRTPKIAIARSTYTSHRICNFKYSTY